MKCFFCDEDAHLDGETAIALPGVRKGQAAHVSCADKTLLQPHFLPLNWQQSLALDRIVERLAGLENP